MSQSAKLHSLNEIKEWVGQVDDDALRFWRREFKYARLVALIETQRQMGHLSESDASAALAELNDLYDLTTIGRRYVAYCRRPPAELEVMVLAMQGGEE